MYRFTNILASLEELAYEILMWFILIPKTIFQVIRDPDWPRRYIKQELSKKLHTNQEEKQKPFSEYMSPVFLYLLVTLFPLFFIFTIPKQFVKINGPTEGVVNQSYIFELENQLAWEKPDSLLISEWDFNSKTWIQKYLFVAESQDIDVALTQAYTKLPIKYYTDANLSKFEYPMSWSEDGRYVIGIKIFNNIYSEFGEVYGNHHEIVIGDVPTEMKFLPFESICKSEPACTKNNSGIELSNFLNDLIYLYALLVLSGPFLVSVVVLKIGSRKGIKDISLREIFYTQCLIIALPSFITQMLILIYKYYLLIPYTHFWLDRIFYSALAMFALIFMWLVFVEVFYFYRFLELSKPKALISVFGLTMIVIILFITGWTMLDYLPVVIFSFYGCLFMVIVVIALIYLIRPKWRKSND